MRICQLLSVVVAASPLVGCASREIRDDDCAQLRAEGKRYSTDWSRIRTPENPDHYWKPANCSSDLTVYPAGAKLGDFFGCVRTEVVIGSSGFVLDAKLVSAYPADERYARSVVETARRTIYRPSDSNLNRIPIRVTLRTYFVPRRGVASGLSPEEKTRQCGA